MSDRIRLSATVQPGGRVEFTVPALPVGETVEVTVEVPSPTGSDRAEAAHAIDLIRSYPPGPRSADTWEEIERFIEAERDAWDR